MQNDLDKAFRKTGETFRPDDEMFVCMDPTGCYHVSWTEEQHATKMAQVSAKHEARYRRHLSAVPDGEGELMERAARALAVNHWGSDKVWRMHLSDAKAALAASRLSQAGEGVTDEMVERAAQTISPNCMWGAGYVNGHIERRRENARGKARAALTAALSGSEK